MKKAELNQRWWYRLIKVIFIACFITSFGIPINLFMEERPYLDDYGSRYAVKCDNGLIRGDFEGSVLDYSRTSFAYDQQNLAKAFILSCKYEHISKDDLSLMLGDSSLLNELKEKNYEIIKIKDAYRGSWFNALGYFLFGLIGILIFFNLARSIFFYVVIGSDFWKSFFWKKHNQE